MPPIRACGSNRQADTHEPSKVCTTAGSRLANTSPTMMVVSGSEEAGRQEDKETRRQGADECGLRPLFPIPLPLSLSPCLLVSLSSCLLVFLSPPLIRREGARAWLL